MINSFAELIQRFDGPAEFGRAVGMSAGAAKQAKRRNHVSVKYFSAIAREAQERAIPGVTVDRLVEMAAQRKTRPS